MFVPVSAFADYFDMLVQHMARSINSNFGFLFKHSRHCFALTLYGCYCPKIFPVITGVSSESLTFQSLFDSCVSFLFFSS